MTVLIPFSPHHASPLLAVCKAGGSACFSENAQSSSDAFQGLNPELQRDRDWAQEQILNVSPLSERTQSSAPSSALQLPRSSAHPVGTGEPSTAPTHSSISSFIQDSLCPCIFLPQPDPYSRFSASCRVKGCSLQKASSTRGKNPFTKS